ncbi:MAG: DUF2490 domain-containing protein [Clostridium sp.]|nr:DUF2490 domain-containing protein [Clostridium sp.]
MSRRWQRAVACVAALWLFVPQGMKAGGRDDFGVWTELEATKLLPYGLSVSVGGEFRTKDLSKSVDRWSGELGIGYKPLSFLKFGASYTYIYEFNAGERKEHYKDDTGLEADWNGWNWTDHYWAQKHRFQGDMTLSTKIDGVLKVTLRERYQYTHRGEQDVDRMKYRFKKDKLTPKPGYPRQDVKQKAEKKTQYLRSRLKLELDKKKWRLTPYVGMELYNDLDDGWRLDKTKFTAGVSYKVVKHHTLSLGYMFNNDIDEDPYEGMHALNIGYSFKF